MGKEVVTDLLKYVHNYGVIFQLMIKMVLLTEIIWSNIYDEFQWPFMETHIRRVEAQLLRCVTCIKVLLEVFGATHLLWNPHKHCSPIKVH